MQLAYCCCRCGIALGYSVDGFILLQWSLPYVEAVKPFVLIGYRANFLCRIVACIVYSGVVRTTSLLRRKVITASPNNKGRCALHVPLTFATLQVSNHPCFIVGSTALFGQRKRNSPSTQLSNTFNYARRNNPHQQRSNVGSHYRRRAQHNWLQLQSLQRSYG